MGSLFCVRLPVHVASGCTPEEEEVEEEEEEGEDEEDERGEEE